MKRQYQTAETEIFLVRREDIITVSDLFENGGYVDGGGNNYDPEIWGAPNFE